jgi:hypothetical protein
VEKVGQQCPNFGVLVASFAVINHPHTVRYVDTGSRDPKQALGTWLSDVLLDPSDRVAEIRVQSGFFGSGALGYFEPALQDLASSDSHTRFLVGSNDGQTPRAAVEDLLAIVGPARGNLAVGVVSFTAGYFHPKVFHFKRIDGSVTAYVGSANLTPPGARSHHVEAGILLDTRDGDPVHVLHTIASAVDSWFSEARGGFYPVLTGADLDALVAAAVLGVPSPPRPTRSVRPPTGGHQTGQPGHPLYPLVAIPAIQIALSNKPPEAKAAAQAGTTAPSVPAPATARPASAKRVAHWSKQIFSSDAQRKATGNQSGAIALTQGDYKRRIDQTTYFRSDLFGAETWRREAAVTGQPKEVALVAMHVKIDGTDHGELQFRVSNASNRESGQNNYTAQLHLEPISPLFRQIDMTGKRLEIERYDDGSYWLTIY